MTNYPETEMSEKNEIIGEFLKNYPKGLPSWDDAFELHPRIIALRKQTSQNREAQAGKWANLLEDLTDAGLDARDTTLSISRGYSGSVRLDTQESMTQYLEFAVSLVAPVFAVFRTYTNGAMGSHLIPDPTDLGSNYEFIVEKVKLYFAYEQLTTAEMARFIENAVVEGIDKEEGSHLYHVLFGCTCVLI